MPEPSREAQAGAEPTRTILGWAPWRATMLAGSVLLLGNAIAHAVMDPDPPSWLRTAATMLGYALLIIGFTLAMRARRR